MLIERRSLELLDADRLLRVTDTVAAERLERRAQELLVLGPRVVDSPLPVAGHVFFDQRVAELVGAVVGRMLRLGQRAVDGIVSQRLDLLLQLRALLRRCRLQLRLELADLRKRLEHLLGDGRGRLVFPHLVPVLVRRVLEHLADVLEEADLRRRVARRDERLDRRDAHQVVVQLDALRLLAPRRRLRVLGRSAALVDVRRLLGAVLARRRLFLRAGFVLRARLVLRPGFVLRARLVLRPAWLLLRARRLLRRRRRLAHRRMRQVLRRRDPIARERLDARVVRQVVAIAGADDAPVVLDDVGRARPRRQQLARVVRVRHQPLVDRLLHARDHLLVGADERLELVRPARQPRRLAREELAEARVDDNVTRALDRDPAMSGEVHDGRVLAHLRELLLPVLAALAAHPLERLGVAGDAIAHRLLDERRVVGAHVRRVVEPLGQLHRFLGRQRA